VFIIFCEFLSLQDREPKGIIPLENVLVREITVKGTKAPCFEIHSASNEFIKACKTDSEGKVVEGNGSLLIVAAIVC